MTHSILLTLNERQLKEILKDLLKEGLKELEHMDRDEEIRILNVTEAAAYLKMKVPTLYEKTSDRLIPHFKKGKRIYFYRHELNQWLAEGKVKTRAELATEAETINMKNRGM